MVGPGGVGKTRLAAQLAGQLSRTFRHGVVWVGLAPVVLLFTLSVSILTGVLFGLAPMMHVVAQNLHETLKAAAGAGPGASPAR